MDEKKPYFGKQMITGMRVRPLLIFSLFILSSCYVFKAYKFRNFELQDLPKLDAVSLPSSPQPFQFSYDTTNHKELAKYLDENLVNSRSYAFLVIRNDSILYERYFGEVTPNSQLPSFSVAKSFTSTLVGMALQEGHIKSLNEPITNYLPELRKSDKDFDNVTIQHILDMRSGVKSNENYSNPFSDVLKMGFASNVSKPALKTSLEQPPGKFAYRSVNTQLLALLVEKATGRKMQDYLIEKLWQPLGMERSATWNVDKKQTVRAFCCINAAARDYAKFGRLFLKKGMWEGKQIVAEDWVNRSTNSDTMLAYDGYKNQWWSEPTRVSFTDSLKAVAFAAGKKGAVVKRFQAKDSGKTSFVVSFHEAYHAEGILGQYVYINPEKNLLIVRLGHNWSHPKFYAQGFVYNVGRML